jgi:drug/metabolite transporter (DMT)-like permease
MLTVAIGLVGALIFGAADFLGGLASKRISALRVTAIVAASGLVVLVAAMPIPLLHGTWSWSAVLLGSLSGVTGALAISLLYGCLAIGPMSILSPTTAVVSAVVPMLAGLVRGERFPLIGYIAIGLALVAIVLVGFVPERGAVRPSAKALLMAVGSGAMIGAFMILIDLTPDDSGLIPLVANRAVNALIMLLVIGGVSALAWRRARRRAGALDADGLVPVTGTGSTSGMERGLDELDQRSSGGSTNVIDGDGWVSTGSTSGMGRGLDELAQRSSGVSTGVIAGRGQGSTASTDGEHATSVRSGWRNGIMLALVGGFIDAIANILLLVGLRLGELTVMSVLTALYPAGTIILAAVVLKERIAPVQIVGLVLAIIAASMLALA